MNEAVTAAEPVTRPTVTPTIEMRAITKTYSGVVALKDVSVQVLPGEVHAILGENGAGKSTLMNIATGNTQPDAGDILVRGDLMPPLTPSLAARNGIAIVHQHPAVLPDLTVLENLEVALPARLLKGGSPAAAAILERIGLRVDLQDRVESLTVAQRHLLEIAKAFAVEPALLILDEPTAPLGSEAVEVLFERVRGLVAGGTSVVYITHRMAEVRELADRVTVLRDGRVRGTSDVADISDEHLLNLIVGRELESTFPPKLTELPGPDQGHDLVLTGLSGPGFVDVHARVPRGAIIGVAGVVGNGQSDLLRALAGLEQFEGRVDIGGREHTARQLLHRAAYMPADRHADGLALSLSVRENAAVSALSSFTRGPLLVRAREVEDVGTTLASMSVRAASLDAPVASLSGGNQQKVVISRALLSDPVLLVADEPTQGVDVGARAEIYGILRDASSRGIPVIIASSDAKELEGLCDQVLVMSRGQVVATLTGAEITEERMVSAAVSSRAGAIAVPEALRAHHTTGLRRFLQGDYAPPALVGALIVLLGAVIAADNSSFLSNFNVTNLLTAATALGFLAMGQNIALITGGIDLSVGPLAGFLVVIASFFINDGKPAGTVVLGLVVMLALAAGVGLVNGGLIRFAGFTPIAATLATYIALGGFALLLRPQQGGYISAAFQAFVNRTIGPVPVFFIVFVLLSAAMEFALRRRPWGWRLRAAGSDEASALAIGVNVTRTVVLGYVATTGFVFLAALMYMGQYGVGDATQGSAFTLTSITAVVLGGTSLLGGRGTFVGPLLGALLLQEVLSATVFFGLGNVWQYYFQGGLILVAAVLYTGSRIRARRPGAQLV